MMRQQERRERTIAMLVREASSAIAERGYDGTTLELIAAGAGLSKGAVYAHFSRKLDLFVLAVERTLAQADTRVGAVCGALRSGEPAVQAARRYVTAVTDPSHAGLIAETWRLAPAEPEIRELLNDHRRARKATLGLAAVDAGQSPREAAATADLVAKLIDAELVEDRLAGPLRLAV